MASSTLSYSIHSQLYSERRHERASDFTLIELTKNDVIPTSMLENGYQPEDAQTYGEMREHCPHCSGVPLQLILRHKFIKRAHLFCHCCMRCYDALYIDGTSALALGAMPLT